MDITICSQARKGNKAYIRNAKSHRTPVAQFRAEQAMGALRGDVLQDLVCFSSAIREMYFHVDIYRLNAVMCSSRNFLRYGSATRTLVECEIATALKASAEFVVIEMYAADAGAGHMQLRLIIWPRNHFVHIFHRKHLINNSEKYKVECKQ